MSAYDYYQFYLKPEDLRGQEHTVKITKAYPKKFFTETKLVLEFENKRKAMKLNSTQAEAMMDITGTEHEKQWIGKEITLSDKVMFNGKRTIKITAKAAALFGSKNVLVEVNHGA